MLGIKRKITDEITALILASFLPTFFIARLYVYFAIRYNIDYAFLVIKGVHIHHLSYGIIILAVVGFLLLTTERAKRKLAVLYGIGLALAFDEFGMWLRLDDNYWIRQSYDAIIIISALFINIIFFKKFWHRCGVFIHKRCVAPVMKKIFIVLLLSLVPLSFAAAGEPNTYNDDFSINLPDRTEDLRDIPPLANPGMFGGQIMAGVSSIPIKYSNRYVTYNEKGFKKNFYRPYGDTITVAELIKTETVSILAGTTLYFFNNSSRLLQVESADGALVNFGMSVAASSNQEPVYSYLFRRPGTYTVRNKLKPYQQVIVEVKDPRDKESCIMRDTSTKEGVTQTKEFRAPWCDVPRDASAVSYPEDETAKMEKPETPVKYIQEPAPCIQVIASARNKITGEIKQFPTPCDIPDGWEKLPLGYQVPAEPRKEKERSAELPPPQKLAQLKGRILLQVESAGEAWYVNPKTGARILLGRPSDAFVSMRKQGIGINNNDLKRLFGVVPGTERELTVKDRAMAQKLAGSILLQVERNGEAYYLDPTNMIAYFLGRPADAFRVMRNRGLGITNENISAVPQATPQ